MSTPSNVRRRSRRSWNPLPALAVALAVAIPTTFTPAIIFSTIARMAGGSPRSRPIVWSIAAAYLAFMYCDRRTPHKNPRTSTWARNVWIWPNGRKYFKTSYSKNVTLRKDRTYLFAMHPHGVFCFSVWLNYVSNRGAFPELRHTRLATISSNFVTPILRDVMMSLGFVPATKDALTYMLKHDQSTALLVGGASEAQINSNKAMRLILHSRLGFIRVALEADSPVVVVLHFNENNTFNSPLAESIAGCKQAEEEAGKDPNGGSLGYKLKKGIIGLQHWFLKTFKFSVPVFLGQYGLPYCPHPVETETVTGDFPIDLRLLTEFYYFLIFNGLPTCVTPQCPLGLRQIPHKHTSDSLNRCYCAMYSTNVEATRQSVGLNLTNTTISSTVPLASSPITITDTTDDTNTNDPAKPTPTLVNTDITPLTRPLNAPRPLTHAEKHDNSHFPVEYQLQQAEVRDYEAILAQLPNSPKKTILLKQLQRYKLKQEKQLLAFAQQQGSDGNKKQPKGDQVRKKAVHYNTSRTKKINNEDKNTNDENNTTATSSSPPQLQTETLVPPQLDPYDTINKPCFLEEIFQIPILTPTQATDLMTRFDPNISLNINQYQSQQQSQPAITYRPQPVNWTQIPDSVARWLLHIYIDQLQQTHTKYNTWNDAQIEIADFNFVNFCLNDCGIYDHVNDIPTQLLDEYRLGTGIDDYLSLFGFNRGMVMGLLGYFLNLKQPSVPLSLDGKSGRPYKRQTETVTQSESIVATTEKNLPNQAQLVIGQGKVAKL